MARPQGRLSPPTCGQNTFVCDAKVFFPDFNHAAPRARCEDVQDADPRRRPPERSSARESLLRRVAGLIPASVGDDCVRVGIDGVDGEGKTTFADELADVVRDAGRQVWRVSVDDFHNVRALRYRLGRSSPEGFWLDSFNYKRTRSDVLTPCGPGGSRRYSPKAHDLATDAVLRPVLQTAPAGAVLIVDGLFLHRAVLAGAWEFSIFLDVSFEVTARRMAARDGTNPDPQHPSMARYVDAQKLYFSSCPPRERAGVLIDNASPDTPRFLRGC